MPPGTQRLWCSRPSTLTRCRYKPHSDHTTRVITFSTPPGCHSARHFMDSCSISPTPVPSLFFWAGTEGRVFWLVRSLDRWDFSSVYPYMSDTNRHVLIQADSLELLSPSQVAAVLLTTERTVYRLVKAGALPPPIKFGRASRWRRSSIAAAIASLDAGMGASGCSEATLI